MSLAEPSFRRQRLILLGLWLLFFCSFALFTPPLLDDADSVHAEVAREMLTRHDFVTLYANGIRYLEKAPLFYWMMAASMKLFGATTAASRLPLAFSVLALVLLLETFARRLFASARAGLYAGLITLSSFGIFIFSRINIPDVLVCVLLTLAIFAYALTLDVPSSTVVTHPNPTLVTPSKPNLVILRQRRRICFLSLLFAAAIGLTLLTKGLIGIVFPLAIVGVHLLLTRGLAGAGRRLLQFHPLASAALLLAIAAPWHILIALANPAQGHPAPITFANGHWQVPLPTDGNVHGWAWFYFVNEQLLRYLNLRVPRDYDTVPLWLFLGLIFIWLMPWSAFLPSALARALPLGNPRFRAALRTRTLAPAESTRLLLILWAAIPLAFFAFSTRQEYYVLPALPPMILLIAALLANPGVPHDHERRSRALSSAGAVPSAALLVLGTLAALACLFLLVHTRTPAPNTDLASLLTQNPADYALSFGHFLDLTGPALGLFRLPLALTAIACLAGGLANFLLRRRARPHAATLALAASAFLFLFAAHRGLVIFSPTLTSAQLADTLRPQQRAEDLIAIHGEYEAGSTLGFYLRRTDLHIVEGRSSNLWYGSFFPDAPRIFETRASIAAKWAGPQRIFLWEDPHDPDRPPLQLPGKVFVVAEGGGKRILSNQPNH